MVEDARCTVVHVCVYVCWDIDEGINENGNVEGGRTLDGETPIRFEYARWMGLRVLLSCRPSSSLPRCCWSRLLEENTRDVKLNYETKLFAYVRYVCAYVGRSWDRVRQVANNFSVVAGGLDVKSWTKQG